MKQRRLRGNYQVDIGNDNGIVIPSKLSDQFKECSHLAIFPCPELKTIFIEPLQNRNDTPDLAQEWSGVYGGVAYHVVDYTDGAAVRLNKSFLHAAGVDGTDDQITVLGVGNRLELTTDWPAQPAEMPYDDLPEELQNFRL